MPAKKSAKSTVSKNTVSYYNNFLMNYDNFTLRADNLTKVYGKKKVVKDVSYQVKQGEIVGLLGPNGAGKTTSFYMTVGLVKPTNGTITFNDQDITKYPMHKRARIGIGYLPQEASIFRKLSVENNILSILEARNQDKSKQMQICNEILEHLHITHIRKQLGYTLSGGERRRAEIGRALAGLPKVILFDEPFAGVDPLAVKDIQSVIKLIQTLNIGVLITDHNVRETLKIVSRAYIISEGNIFIEGTAKQLIKSKKAKENYLGKDFKL